MLCVLNVLRVLPARALSLGQRRVWLQGAERQPQGPRVVLLSAVLALTCGVSSVLPSYFWPPVQAGQA